MGQLFKSKSLYSKHNKYYVQNIFNYIHNKTKEPRIFFKYQSFISTKLHNNILLLFLCSDYLRLKFFFSSINCLWNSSCLVFKNISSYILCCCIISLASILSFVALSCTSIFILATLFCDSRVAFVALATTYILKVLNFYICFIIDCSLLPHNATNLDNAFAIDWLSWSTSGCFRFSDVLW